MAQARLQSSRQYWVRADVCCLMCGRRLGHVLGPTEPMASRHPSAGPRLVFGVFRATNPDIPPRPVGPAVRFRCLTCGGQGVIDELQTLSIRNNTTPEDQAEPDHAPTTSARPPDLRLLT